MKMQSINDGSSSLIKYFQDVRLNATDAVAASAATSPVWMPFVKEVSDVAAMLLPIAGLTWLVIQMVFFIKDKRKNGKS